MVEISLSGSGEGPGKATTRGYSTTVHRPLENSRMLMFVHVALRATRDNQGTSGAIAGQERNRASLHRALGGYRFVTRRNAVNQERRAMEKHWKQR